MLAALHEGGNRLVRRHAAALDFEGKSFADTCAEQSVFDIRGTGRSEAQFDGKAAGVSSAHAPWGAGSFVMQVRFTVAYDSKPVGRVVLGSSNTALAQLQAGL